MQLTFNRIKTNYHSVCFSRLKEHNVYFPQRTPLVVYSKPINLAIPNLRTFTSVHSGVHSRGRAGTIPTNWNDIKHEPDLLKELLPPTAPPITAETITDAVVSRHKPTLNSGRIEGSLRVLLGESFSITNAISITSDVFCQAIPRFRSTMVRNTAD